jgi:chromosome segregation and condensation protein ScpB
VDRVGLATLFPIDDLVLPSLWEAVAGTPEITWSSWDEGRFLDFSPEFGRVLGWKDELPERRLVCVGKHVQGRSALVSLALLPSLYASRGGPEELSPLEQDVFAFLAEQGPCSTADLPDLVGHERKRVARAVDRLQRRLVLTTAGAQERAQGWPAVIVDVLERRYAEHLRRLPEPRDAHARLAEVVLASARELSAADLAAVIGCTRKQAGVALDRLVDEGRARRREEPDFVLYLRRRAT